MYSLTSESLLGPVRDVRSELLLSMDGVIVPAGSCAESSGLVVCATCGAGIDADRIDKGSTQLGTT